MDKYRKGAAASAPFTMLKTVGDVFWQMMKKEKNVWNILFAM